MSNATTSLVIEAYGKGGRNIYLPVDGGTTIYKGTQVAQLVSTGMLVPATTSGAGPTIGVAVHDIDNSGGSDADVYCDVRTDQIFCFANGTSTDACSDATLVGAPVYAADDHTVYDNDASGTLKRAGYFAGMEEDGRVRVFITAFGVGATATAVTVLTFTAVAGTANNTLAAVPNPTDTPASADALRDDLVATLIPPIRDNFADLASKVNELRSILVAAGLAS